MEKAQEASNWYSIVIPAAAVTCSAILAFVAAYFNKAKEQLETPAGSVLPSRITATAIGAAFIDESAASAIMRMDANVDAIAKSIKERDEREHEDEIADRVLEKAERRAAERAERNAVRQANKQDKD